MESFEFRAAFHVCSWLRECHSFDRKTTELIQLFQYTTTRSLMIFNVYVRMNNIITRKIERLRALITLAVCTRPNFRRFVPLRFCVAKIWPGTRLIANKPRPPISPWSFISESSSPALAAEVAAPILLANYNVDPLSERVGLAGLQMDKKDRRADVAVDGYAIK